MEKRINKRKSEENPKNKVGNNYKIYSEKEVINFIEDNGLSTDIVDCPGYHKELWELIKGEEAILEVNDVNKNEKQLVIKLRLVAS